MILKPRDRSLLAIVTDCGPTVRWRAATSTPERHTPKKQKPQRQTPASRLVSPPDTGYSRLTMDTAHLTPLGLPPTLAEAVDRLNDILGPDDKRTIAETLEDDLVDFHFGLGLAIRNAFKLHRGNLALLASRGTTHPDDTG